MIVYDTQTTELCESRSAAPPTAAPRPSAAAADDSADLTIHRSAPRLCIGKRSRPTGDLLRAVGSFARHTGHACCTPLFRSSSTTPRGSGAHEPLSRAELRTVEALQTDGASSPSRRHLLLPPPPPPPAFLCSFRRLCFGCHRATLRSANATHRCLCQLTFQCRLALHAAVVRDLALVAGLVDRAAGDGAPGCAAVGSPEGGRGGFLFFFYFWLWAV